MRFGIELEVTGHHGTFIQAARDAGIVIQSEGYNHDTRRHWKVVGDATISGPGFEVVSPILESTDMDSFEQIRKVCAALASANCSVNSSCGYHVHVEAAGMTPGHFKTLMKLYAKFEPVMDQMMPRSRRGNANVYCRSFLDGQGTTAEQVSKFFVAVDSATSVQALFNHLMRYKHIAAYEGRYFKLNIAAFFRHGTVEFRQHSGTIEADKVINWAKFCIALRARASRPKARVVVTGAGEFDTLFSAVKDKELKRFYRKRIAALNATAAAGQEVA